MGGSSNITSNASSPDGRLTYSYSTSAGNISSSTSTATLDSTGAQPGTITVTCNVADDRNPAPTVSSTTMVTVLAPPPPPDTGAVEKRLALCPCLEVRNDQQAASNRFRFWRREQPRYLCGLSAMVLAYGDQI